MAIILTIEAAVQPIGKILLRPTARIAELLDQVHESACTLSFTKTQRLTPVDTTGKVNVASPMAICWNSGLSDI